MFVGPEKIEKMEKPDLVQTRQQILYTIDELDAERKQIDERLMEKMEADTEFIDEFEVKRITRTTLDVTLDRAKELGAIVMKEAIDTPLLNKMRKDGNVGIPTKTYSFIQVKEMEE
jgi:hypothetical protein